MAVFKCKMCGGTIEFNKGDTVGVCDSCGTKQTLPYLDDERRANLYDRANHFRRNNDYDKAMGIYETILNEDLTDAESYWSILLCKYGIEYVEDPTAHKYLPTINRVQYTSIFEDEDYKSAIKNADALQKEIYEQEATVINEIQKGILEISSKEEPFDVFICYKETDVNGRRTQDSVLATELYHELTKEGFKVFFSRITLEDKLGTAYEPYIFAALNSAKVMVVLGTKPEYFNAIWVKNEWSRYLALIKNGAKKMLIPAYRDMDPYDLPEEFSHLQAQDMSKLGFMQDLIRGIKKVVAGDNRNFVINNLPENKTVKNTDALIDRAFILLEQKSWKQADSYFEQILSDNPKNSEAYLGKCMVNLSIPRKDEIIKQAKKVLKNKNYKFAIRFAENSNSGYLNNLNDSLKKSVKARAEKVKKRLVISIITVLSLICLSALTYYVGIPTGRYLYYKNLVSDGKTKKAISKYTNSVWFEYDNKIKNMFYDSANEFVEKENYFDAGIIFKSFSEFKDSKKNLESIKFPFEKAMLKNAKVGDTVEFGVYEQDANVNNGKENIEWIVLEKEVDKTFLISKYVLDYQPYNTILSNVTWEKCSLRKWMNEDFFNTAFSSEEKENILKTNVTPDSNPYFNINQGNETSDKMFLLSIEEVNKYLKRKKDSMGRPTNYMLKLDTMVCNKAYESDWLLRTLSDQDAVCFVDCNGKASKMGACFVDAKSCVRPAMWVNIEK